MITLLSKKGSGLKGLATLARLLLVAAVLGCRADRPVEPTPPEPTPPLVAAKIEFDSQPVESAISATSLGNIRVRLVTKDGQLAAGSNYTVTLSLASSDTSAHLAGDTLVVTNTGIASFNRLSVARAGQDFHLTARVEGLEPVASRSFSVTHGPASLLRFRSYTRTAFVGNALTVVAEISDSAGNLVTDASNRVFLSYAYVRAYGYTSLADSIFGDTTMVAVNGVARFDGVSFHKAGSYTLSIRSPGLHDEWSGSVDVFWGTLVKLAFNVQPTDGVAGSPLPAFSVVRVDKFGNGFGSPSTARYSATVSLGQNPSGASATGTLSAQESVLFPLIFQDVRIDKAGTGYTLIAKTNDSLGLTGESAPFNVR
jgi:hypothetical protein